EAGTAADADYLKVIEEADRRIRELEAERAEAEKAADGKADAGRFLGIKERQAGRKCLKTARTVRVKLRIAACSPPPLTFWNLKPVYLTHV
ncbi:MAG: hypothetical protein LBJ86_05260, partial [Spirochaetaceae bacterium]|nr:hypothetical protein [Spirochaetaceae bacterium]